MTSDRLRQNALALAGALLAMAVAWLLFSGGVTDGVDDRGEDVTAVTVESPLGSAGDDEDDAPDETDGSVGATADRASDLPTITVDELPPEAVDTLDRIDAGGPYPYRQDDETFQNREGLLPDRPRGHYREYTVDTPGSDDRGARRIVTGADGEAYWTDDHYASFREILP